MPVDTLPSPAAAPARHLIVRLRNYVGDVVLGVPALRAIESRGYRLTLVGKGWAKSLLAGHGWTVHKRAATFREQIAQLRDLRRQCASQDPGFLKRENAYVMPQSFGSALEMRLAGLRPVGYDFEARGWLLSRSRRMNLGEHELKIYHDLASFFLREELPLPVAIDLQVLPAHQQQADEALRSRGVGAGFVVIVPFSGGAIEKLGKKWPHFIDYTRWLLAQGHTVVACPGPGEDRLISEQYPGEVVMLENLDLGTYAGVLRRAALVVANDTGPGHMAAAVGAPLLSIFGASRHLQWAPWGPTATYVQGYPQWPSLDRAIAYTHELLAGRVPTPWIAP